MGHGYHILVWDDWASGLNMVNPRLLTDDDGNNWWPCEHNMSVSDVCAKHDLEERFDELWWVIW